MLTVEEVAVLESLLFRARACARIDPAIAIQPGDVVQILPGADSHWETSLLLVGKVREDSRVSGAILRPHRSGCREAWATFTLPEIVRIGACLYGPPCRAIRDQSYLVPCSKCV